MHVLVIGADGMIGRKLAQRLAQGCVLGDREVVRLSLVDVIQRSQSTRTCCSSP